MSHSHGHSPQQQMSFSKQQQAVEPTSSRNLPSLVPFWWWSSQTATLHSVTKRAFTSKTSWGPHGTSARPSPVCWPGIQGGTGLSVVPSPEPRMSPSLFQLLTAQDLGFCGLIMHFHTPMRQFKMWEFSVWWAELLEDFSCSSCGDGATHTGSLWGG